MAASVAANAFNSYELCVAVMAQPCMLARDVAALACVNKTAARAAREAGWHALMMRTLPHAVRAKRDAVTTLRAYKEVTDAKPDVMDLWHGQSFICSLRRADGTPLLTNPYWIPPVNSMPKVYPKGTVPIRGVELSQSTASLFVELPLPGGRGVRVACIFNLLNVSRIYDSEDPDDDSDAEENITNEWLRDGSNSMFDIFGSGRVHVFTNVNTEQAVHFEMDRGRDDVEEAYKEHHVGCFAVLVHEPADGSAPTVWLRIRVMYWKLDDEGEPDGPVMEPIKKQSMARILKTLKWRHC